MDQAQRPTSFPDVELQGQRVKLRRFGAVDVDATLAACNDPISQRWLPFPRPYRRIHAEEWCCRLAAKLREEGDGINLAASDPASGALIGSVSLKRTNWRSLVTEVGYWTVPAFRGQGLTTEAVRLLSEWALHTVERVELVAAPGNTASRRVAEKAGFSFEGVMRNAGFVHDGRVDLCLYSLIRADMVS